MVQKRSKQTGDRQSSIPPDLIKPLASFMLTRIIDSPVSEQKEEIEKIQESVTPADMFNKVIKSLLQTMVDAEMDAILVGLVMLISLMKAQTKP